MVLIDNLPKDVALEVACCILGDASKKRSAGPKPVRSTSHPALEAPHDATKP